MRPLLKNCKASMNKSLYNQCLANPEPIRILGILSCRPWSKTTVGSTVEKPVFPIRTTKKFSRNHEIRIPNRHLFNRISYNCSNYVTITYLTLRSHFPPVCCKIQLLAICISFLLRPNIAFYKKLEDSALLKLQ